MIETEISLPRKATDSQIVKSVEVSATGEGLTLTLKGTLAKYPGCSHWHFKKGRQTGTLEVTWWPRPRRLWIKVATNRNSAWVEDAVPRLKQSIESNL